MINRLVNRLTTDVQAYYKAFIWEWKYIFKDKAVLMSFIGVALLVSVLYTYLYSEETLTNLPIGIIDHDNTSNSRKLLRMIDASDDVNITQAFASLNEAKIAFKQDKLRGIVEIEKHFSKHLQKGLQPEITVYADASYILYYKQVLTGVKTAVSFFNAGIQIKKASSKGLLPNAAKTESIPVNATTVSLYNPSSGYATFLLPIVFIIIFQTTILTAIGILGGSMQEERKFTKLYPNSNYILGTLPIVMGKATTYLLISYGILLFIIGVVMPVFNIPMRTNLVLVFVFLTPYILALAYLGLFLLTFFKRREDAIMVILFSSIPCLLITGFSWPLEAIPQWQQSLSYLVPSTLGSKGFVALTQMRASLNELTSIWLGMWGVCLFYLALATMAIKLIYLKEISIKKNEPKF